TLCAQIQKPCRPASSFASPVDFSWRLIPRHEPALTQATCGPCPRRAPGSKTCREETAKTILEIASPGDRGAALRKSGEAGRSLHPTAYLLLIGLLPDCVRRRQSCPLSSSVSFGFD